MKPEEKPHVSVYLARVAIREMSKRRVTRKAARQWAEVFGLPGNLAHLEIEIIRAADTALDALHQAEEAAGGHRPWTIADLHACARVLDRQGVVEIPGTMLGDLLRCTAGCAPALERLGGGLCHLAATYSRASGEDQDR